MCALALMTTYLKPSSRVVDYPDTFFSCYVMDLLSDNYLEFCNCFWIILMHMIKSSKDRKLVDSNLVNVVTILECNVC